MILQKKCIILSYLFVLFQVPVLSRLLGRMVGLSPLTITLCPLLTLLTLLLHTADPVSANSDTSGPVFIQEPPNNVDFSNTTGSL